MNEDLHEEHFVAQPLCQLCQEPWLLDPDDIDATPVVLSQMITDEQVLAADDTDVLAGSALDQVGVPGVYTVWAASTVGDSLLTITMGGRSVLNGGVVVLRANSEIRENEDTFYQMLSRTGNRPVINLNIVTAASVRIRTKFIPAIAS